MVTILTYFFCLYYLTPQQILQQVSDLIIIFAQVAISPLETREVKVQIGGALAHLISTYGKQMLPMLKSLPQPYARALAAILPNS